MKIPNKYDDYKAYDDFIRNHPEWTGAINLCELIGDEKIVGFQIITLGRTKVYRLRFDNGVCLRIHGYKDLKDPDIIQLAVESYNIEF